MADDARLVDKAVTYNFVDLDERQALDHTCVDQAHGNDIAARLRDRTRVEGLVAKHPGVRDVAVASGKAIDQVLADKGDLTYFAVGVDLTKRADGVLFL